MEPELVLRIVLEKASTNVDFGLQKVGAVTIQTQRSEAKDLYFEFTVRVKASGKDAVPTFSWSARAGPSDQRFIYIDVGRYAGQRTHVGVAG